MTETQYIKSPERSKKYSVEYEIFDPEVKIKNNLFPFEHEYYNCSTCNRSRSQRLGTNNTIESWCGFNLKWRTERKDLIDNGCGAHSRKIARPI